jgi:ketosteroid isomerase-like protein
MMRAVSAPANVQILRRAWDAIARGDAEDLRAVVAPDVVWHATARGAPWSGEHRGAEVMLDFLARVGEVTDVFDAQLVDVLASEQRVLVVFHVRLGIGARRLEVDYLLLARIAGGLAQEIWTAPLEPAALEAFFADD